MSTVVTPFMLAALVGDIAALVNVPVRKGGMIDFPFGQRRVGVSPGARRYLRIITEALDEHGQVQTGSARVYGFLDMETGCLLYPASWKSPDPVPRGHLFDPIDPSHGRKALGPAMVHNLDAASLDPDVLWNLRAKYAPATITPELSARVTKSRCDDCGRIGAHNLEVEH